MSYENKNLTEKDRETLKTMNVQHNKTGDGFVAYTLTGEPLPEENMTADQRDALKHYQAGVFPPKAPAVKAIPVNPAAPPTGSAPAPPAVPPAGGQTGS